MVAKNGFLFIELMISLTLTFFLIFLLAHYIIEIKKTQYEVIRKIDIFSIARNYAEKMIALNETTNASYHCDGYDIKITDSVVDCNNSNNKIPIKNITIEKNGNSWQVHVPVYIHKEKMIYGIHE